MGLSGSSSRPQASISLASAELTQGADGSTRLGQMAGALVSHNIPSREAKYTPVGTRPGRQSRTAALLLQGRRREFGTESLLCPSHHTDRHGQTPRKQHRVSVFCLPQRNRIQGPDRSFAGKTATKARIITRARHFLPLRPFSLLQASSVDRETRWGHYFRRQA